MILNIYRFQNQAHEKELMESDPTLPTLNSQNKKSLHSKIHKIKNKNHQEEVVDMIPTSDSPLFLVYHIAFIGRWRNIVKTHAHKILTSSILSSDQFQKLTITCVGDQRLFEEYIDFDLFSDVVDGDNKIEIIHSSTNVSKFERPGIEKVIEIANNNPTSRIGYFHSKGVTRKKDEVKDWVDYMLYILLEHYPFAIQKLDAGFDIVGVNFYPIKKNKCSNKNCFWGNFWWSRADYISSRLTIPLHESDRHEYEFYIGYGRPLKVWEFSHLNVDLKDDPIKRKDYVGCEHKGRSFIFSSKVPLHGEHYETLKEKEEREKKEKEEAEEEEKGNKKSIGKSKRKENPDKKKKPQRLDDDPDIKK